MSIGEIHRGWQIAPVMPPGCHADAVLQDDVGGVVFDEDLVDVLDRVLGVDLVQLKEEKIDMTRVQSCVQMVIPDRPKNRPTEKKRINPRKYSGN